MKFDFNTRVNRENRGNLKALVFTPQCVKEKGFVSYSGAEFEFRTAPCIIRAVKETAENGLFGFTVPDSEYAAHICWWMNNVRKSAVKPEWILPVQGTIFAVATAIRLFSKEGEGIIIPVPGYNRYEQAAERLGRRSVLVPMKEETGYFLDMAALEAVMAEPSNRLLILCNPNNPTGQIIPEKTLKEILGMAARHQVAVICDEIFADVVLGEQEVPNLTAIAEDSAQVISIISLGKTFSLTGVNHANVLIRNEELRERFRLQRNADHFGSIDPTAYAALLGGYSQEGKEWLEELRQVIRTNDEKINEFFKEYFPAVKAYIPQATYELWVDFEGLGLSGEELFAFLEKEAYFSCDPGDEYYGRPCMARICTAVPPLELERSLAALLAAARARGLTTK